MKLIKYITFALIVLNLPSIGLFAFGSSVGALLSFITILSLTLFYFFEEKTTPNWWLIIISLLLYTIGGLNYIGLTSDFIYDAIKFFIYLITGYELAKNISVYEYNVFLLLGALSVILDALLFTDDFGRYSGFYIKPNEAGFICITGYATTYGLKNLNLKLFGQFLFTLAGLLTFSRTFIVIWIMLNLISLKINIKNIRIFGLGFLIISTLFFIDEVVGLNNPRFEQLKSIVSNDGGVSTEELNEDSREETWARFYDKIFDSPLIGNGYGTFSGKTGVLGVHNSYLMLIGEAGILPFLLFIAYFGYLFVMSLIYFNKKPNLIMQFIALAMFLMANHNFFTFYYVSFAAMWIQYQIVSIKREEELVLNSSF